MSPGQVLCAALVGRDEERGNLATALVAAEAGQGSIGFVLGEAGVGKSRLVDEIAALATEGELRVLAGRALDEQTPVPFRPLSEALVSAFRPNGPPLNAELQPFRAALGRLVPEWQEDYAASAEASLLLVSEAVLRLLASLATGSGCLLVLEDLQWSDPETLIVLDYLADNLASERVLCLATVRNDQPSRALALARSLHARRAARTVELARLSPTDTERMTAACLDVATVPRELVEPVRTWTDGLPFLVEELLAAWIATGTLEDRPEGWTVRSPLAPTVPATFADTVGRRLATLGSQGEAVMTAAAVLGQRFEWELVSAVTGLDRDTVMAVLHRAVAAQLVSDDGREGRKGFRLRHALTRQAILAGLLSPERADLSSRALRAVEEAHPALPGSWCDLAAELARASGDVERAARLLLVVGRRALAQGALVSAEAALERARGFVTASPAVLASLDELLTEVLSLAGKAEHAVEAGQRLLAALERQEAAPARRAQVHLRLARALLSSGSWTSAARQLDLARRLVGPAWDPAILARLDALAAHVALGEARLEEAEALATTALATAERGGLPEVACEALEVIGRCSRLSRRPGIADAEAAFGRARLIAEQHGLVLWRIRALQELASIDVATTRRLDRLTSTRDIAYQAGALATTVVLDLHIATVLAFRLEADEGLAVARRCEQAARRYDVAGLLLPMARARQAVLPMTLLRQAQCHAVLDDAKQMESCIAQALALAPGDPEIGAGAWGQCRATLSLLRENRARALRELATGAEFVRGRPDALLWVFRGLWAVVAAVEDRDAKVARDDLEISGLIALPHHRAFLGYADAVVLGRRGQGREADEAAAAARSEMAEAGGGFGAGYLALRLVAEAAILDGWGDPVAWLREAERFFEGVGQGRVASACRSLLGKAGVPRPRRRQQRTAVPARLAGMGVSGREHEVLVLVAEGLSNPAIADRLYVSSRTVDKHVEHLLAKTGCKNRFSSGSCGRLRSE